jgi:membrane dipeptidase
VIGTTGSIRARVLLLALSVPAGAGCTPSAPPAAVAPAAPAAAPAAPADVHTRAIVVDSHDDTTQRMFFDKTFDLGARHADGNIDIPRMREGGLDALVERGAQR